jgi:hypothetical protein
MEAELIALDTATVEAQWLRELLIDVIRKVNSSKEYIKSSRHVKRRLKSENEKLRSYCVGLYPNV